MCRENRSDATLVGQTEALPVGMAMFVNVRATMANSSR